MLNQELKYYILFRNYNQGLKLHELLTAQGIENRIAPAPRSVQGKLSCGMSLLITPGEIERTKACIEENEAEYYEIVALEGQNRSNRDRYC